MTVRASWNPLAPSAIALQRRPGFLAFAYAVRSVFALLAALLIASSVGASGIGEFRGGDALLFEDGGLYLLELLRLSSPELFASTSAALAVLCLGLCSNLLVAAVLLVAFNTDGRLEFGAAVGRAISVFPRFFLLGALILAGQSLLLLGASLTGALVQSSYPSERAVDLATLGIALVFGLAALALGSLLDVARACAVRHELRVKHALLFALDAARRSPLPVLFGWLPFAVVGTLVVAGAALFSDRIDVARPGSGRLLVVALLHQLTLVVLLILRGAWLARALSLAARHVPSRHLAI